MEYHDSLGLKDEDKSSSMPGGKCYNVFAVMQKDDTLHGTKDYFPYALKAGTPEDQKPFQENEPELDFANKWFSLPSQPYLLILFCIKIQLSKLQQKLMVLMMSGASGISVFPESDNLFKWIGAIHGVTGTVYEGLQYKLPLEFPSGYPYNAPSVKFLTPCYHPNVDLQENICLDILKDKWSALYDIWTILLFIQMMLGEPNIESPLNTDAAELWKNQAAYRSHLHESYAKNMRSRDT